LKRKEKWWNFIKRKFIEES